MIARPTLSEGFISKLIFPITGGVQSHHYFRCVCPPWFEETRFGNSSKGAYWCVILPSYLKCYTAYKVLTTELLIAVSADCYVPAEWLWCTSSKSTIWARLAIELGPQILAKGTHIGRHAHEPGSTYSTYIK